MQPLFTRKIERCPDWVENWAFLLLPEMCGIEFGSLCVITYRKQSDAELPLR